MIKKWFVVTAGFVGHVGAGDIGEITARRLARTMDVNDANNNPHLAIEAASYSDARDAFFRAERATVKP